MLSPFEIYNFRLQFTKRQITLDFVLRKTFPENSFYYTYLRLSKQWYFSIILEVDILHVLTPLHKRRTPNVMPESYEVLNSKVFEHMKTYRICVFGAFDIRCIKLRC